MPVRRYLEAIHKPSGAIAKRIDVSYADYAAVKQIRHGFQAECPPDWTTRVITEEGD